MFPAAQELGGILEANQVEGLVSCAECEVHGASANTRSATIVTSPDPFSEGNEDVRALGLRGVIKVQGAAPLLDKSAPVAIVGFVTGVIYDAIGNICPCSTEITFD